MTFSHSQAPAQGSIPQPNLVVLCARHQQRLGLLPLCIAGLVHGVQRKHCLCVAYQAGSAAHVCQAQDANGFTVR